MVCGAVRGLQGLFLKNALEGQKQARQKAVRFVVVPRFLFKRESA